MLLGGSVRAQLVVNEVLANEPGSATSLEWIELYNTGTALSLDNYSLRISSNVIELPHGITLVEGEYFIVCRRLFASSTSPGFESHWGDSSGVWGDNPFENSIQMPFEVAMSLANDTGCVELLGGGTAIDSFTWSRSGLDGYSWEKVTPGDDSVGQSTDLSGSTPGFLNSVTAVQYDLFLTDIQVSSGRGTTRISIEITNTGLEPIESAYLYLIITVPEPLDTLDIIAVEPVEPGATTRMDREYTLDGMYIPMQAILSDDDRNRNNTAEFMSVGQHYPPLVLSEFLANPTGNLSSEWVEIKNRSDQAVDLSNWFIGDALRVNSMCGESVLIGPHDYFVLAQDSAGFLAFYGGFERMLVEPGAWASLNNDADMARLVDSYGIEADRFEYESTYETNYTWARTEEPLELAKWGRSEDIGGTPGEANEVIITEESSILSLTVDPLYVSPDGDGFEDFTVITVEAPPADCYTVKIYDRQGRVVRTLYEEESMIPSEIEWDGLSDAGRRLPVGLYIVYVEASGVESARKPVVVAR